MSVVTGGVTGYVCEMSSAARVKKHRERRRDDGRRRFELSMTPDEALRVRAFLESERSAQRRFEALRSDSISARGSWPNETWADYIAFAQAGLTGQEGDDPKIERDRTPDPAYMLVFD